VPVIPEQLGGAVPGSVSPASKNPQGYMGFIGLPGAARVGAQLTTVYCSPACRIEGRAGGGVAFYHVIPCLKSHEDLIEHTPEVLMLKKGPCRLSDDSDHTDIGECPKFEQMVARGVVRVTQAQAAPSPSPI